MNKVILIAFTLLVSCSENESNKVSDSHNLNSQAPGRGLIQDTMPVKTPEGSDTIATVAPEETDSMPIAEPDTIDMIR